MIWMFSKKVNFTNNIFELLKPYSLWKIDLNRSFFKQGGEGDSISTLPVPYLLLHLNLKDQKYYHLSFVFFWLFIHICSIYTHNYYFIDIGKYEYITL